MRLEGMLADEVVLSEVGRRLAQRRLELKLSQADVAEQAGVSKRTVARVEAGATTQFVTLIRLLRVLGLFDNLETLIPETGPRPMDLLKLKGKVRQRAPKKKMVQEDGPAWTWRDDA